MAYQRVEFSSVSSCKFLSVCYFNNRDFLFLAFNRLLFPEAVSDIMVHAYLFLIGYSFTCYISYYLGS